MNYNRAWNLLEAADHRAGRARKIVKFDHYRLSASFTGPKAANLYACVWPSGRRERWADADKQARAQASVAVEAASVVQVVRKLTDKLRNGNDLRAYAKAVAARIETEAAVFDEAYGRAMPKEWWSK